MSSTEVREKARETLKSVKELLKAVKDAAHAELSTTTPKVVHTLDKQFDRAAKGLSDTLRLIDKKTGKEQMELLKMYKSLLQKQAEFVQKKMESMEKEQSKS